MIKIRYLLISIMLSVILSGCADALQSGEEKTIQNQTEEIMTMHPDTTDNTSIDTPATLSDKDFIIKNNDTFIELNGNYENLISNEEIVQVSYLDENHVYDTYVYENFIISVSPPGNVIFHINLLTSELETSRGISIGDSISDVCDKYGVPDSMASEYYLYTYEHDLLFFYIDEYGKVTKIKFEMI